MSGPPAGLRFRYEPGPEDPARVRAIVAATGVFSPAEVEVAEELVHEALAAGAASDYRFVFVELDGVTRAYACYGPIALTAASYDLYWIAVDPAVQGRGLGRAALEETERQIRTAGGARVWIDTSHRPRYAPTRAFYERCGYRLVARLPEFYGPGDDKAIYGKPLAAGER